jgi:opacity protein-like surface antigen
MKALLISAVSACLLGLATPAHAQTSEFMLRGFADVGSTTFTAERSFEAVLGDARGPVWGGGVEVVLPFPVFVDLRASQFKQTGERVFLYQGEQYDLGIPTTVTITPLTLIAGYRGDFGWRIIPYGGGGLGWHRYRETSRFAQASENVDERFQGYHLLGGAEFRVARWIGTAFEAEWSTVPDALGTDPNGVSKEFDETDLGGVTFRVKIVVGH